MDEINVSEKLALYSQLNEQKKQIEKQLADIKKVLEPVVIEKGGEIVDDAGTVKLVEVSGGWSISDAARLVEQATIWSQSGNVDIATLGQTVLTFAKEKQGYSFLKFS